MILSDQHRMVRDMARSFAEKELVPCAADWDREAKFPTEAVSKMGKLGLMGMMVPEEWGGSGTDFVSYALAIEEIAAGDGSCSTIMSVNNTPVCAAILREGTENQKEHYLKPLASGEKLGAFCLTEPQAGSDASSILTRVNLVGDKYVLNGTKQFVTSGASADLALVFATLNPDAGKDGISAFLVPTDHKGYRVTKREKKLGQRASETCQITFENLELGRKHLLGKLGEGYRIALSNLEGGRIGVAAQAIGLARAAAHAAINYAQDREAFGGPIIDQQSVAFRLADMATQITAARQLVLHAASRRDAGKNCLMESAMAKLFAAEMAERVCSDAIQVHGGYGYLNDFPVERIYRDVRVCQIYEGTSEIQRLIISRAIRNGGVK